MNPIVTIQIPGRGQPQGETVEPADERGFVRADMRAARLVHSPTRETNSGGAVVSEISPDPHFAAKLATITSREELAAFYEGIPPQRRLSDGELRLIVIKDGELRRERK